MNVTLVQGVLRREPDRRDLPGGGCAISFELTAESPLGDSEVVPVVSYAEIPALAVGGSVVVFGRVRKRFFRSGALTQARTEVVAERVVPARRHAVVARLADQAIEAIGQACAGRSGRAAG